MFPKLLDSGRKCMSDGADAIYLGSTTMHQAHGFLAENLPVPVVNPGPLTYKLAELVLGLRLTHSRAAYPKPNVSKDAMMHAMLEAAASGEPASAR